MLFLGQHIIVPVIYSVIIAIVLSPIVKFFVTCKMNRVIAIAITLLLIISITLSAVIIISMQIRTFGDSFPILIIKFNTLLDQSIVWVCGHFNISKPNVNLWISQTKSGLLNGSQFALGDTLLSTGSILVVLILIPVYVFMILFYEPLLLEFIHKLFSSDKQKEVAEVLTATKRIIQSYLVGLLLEAVIIATLNSACLLILGIQYAILLGVIG
ncbi:MAG TPA: AI-2E family transporter, partial [Nitrosopumilaceae archaeon]|nr:AI-2E family transporter [Nitrosopumilaceae archaeon]